MSAPLCVINFDNNLKRVFNAGQSISGHVVVTLHKEKMIKSLYMILNGKCETFWSGKSEQNSGTEYYVTLTQNFMGAVGSTAALPVRGIHRFNFAFQLPDKLPTSFEGKYGYIRYTAEVIFDQLNGPMTFIEPFTVIKELNLSERLALRTPIEYEKFHKFQLCCFFCFKSKPIHVLVRLPASGFTPGQIIQFHVEANNQSNKNILNLEMGLYLVANYYCEQNPNKIKTESIKLANTLLGDCLIGAEEIFEKQITVPSTPPTDTSNSNLCKIEYQLKLKASVAGCFCYNKLCIKTPITIGTIPFQEPVQRPSAPNMDQPLANNAVPPTYEQALSGNTQIQGNNYAPCYPVYHNNLIGAVQQGAGYQPYKYTVE